jgi:hypothetical protein
LGWLEEKAMSKCGEDLDSTTSDDQGDRRSRFRGQAPCLPVSDHCCRSDRKPGIFASTSVKLPKLEVTSCGASWASTSASKSLGKLEVFQVLQVFSRPSRKAKSLIGPFDVIIMALPINRNRGERGFKLDAIAQEMILNTSRPSAHAMA